MDLQKIQENAKELTEKHGWQNESLSTRINYLKSEVEEVVQELELLANQGYNCNECKERLGFELFDVVWNVAEIANRFGIDLSKVSKEKMKINEGREWDNGVESV